MIGLIIGLFLGSAFTVMIMSLMVVSKQADEASTNRPSNKHVHYRKYTDQFE